jgi:hypothetical protein
MAARPLELAAVAGLLKQLGIYLQSDRCRPSNRRPIYSKSVVAERVLEAMQQTPQARPYHFFTALRPQHGGKDVAPD